MNLIRVALPVPLRKAFDYRWEGPDAKPDVGVRVRVPFGRREMVGVVLEHPTITTTDEDKLRDAISSLDGQALLEPSLMSLLRWAADYYCHPIGEVFAAALPGALKKGKPPHRPVPYWQLSETGRGQDHTVLAQRAPRQAAILTALAAGPVAEPELITRGGSKPALKRLMALGFVDAAAAPEEPKPRLVEGPKLTPDQTTTVDAISASKGFQTHLVFGVTGSGKTEVYLRLIERHIHSGRQTLMLVPEISLTPQMVSRLEARFGAGLAVMHSNLTDSERQLAWRRASRGQAKLILGTRSAIFAPLPTPGLIVVDEEHDASYKQQDGFRYNARDLAVVRARMLEIPVVLGSATPSLESLANAKQSRYILHELKNRIGAAGSPSVSLLDLNKHAVNEGISTPLVNAMGHHLAKQQQIMLFINRRGFAPALFCSTCETVQPCPRCDSNLTLHLRQNRLRCHHCGHERPLEWACPQCGGERTAVGEGTQRIEQTIAKLFPDARVARLDRDAVQQRDQLAQLLEAVSNNDVDILVGTQMLTKGHDFPNVTLVGVLNADQGLFGSDFRASERLAQTIVQVAGRAGRADRPGEVLIQTHFPQHPLLRCLVEGSYGEFAELALEERQLSGWPPFGRLAILRAEAHQRETVDRFLTAAKFAALKRIGGGVHLLGPAAPPMERRAGRYRLQLLALADHRKALRVLLEEWPDELAGLPDARRVRYALDVDPQDL